MRDPEDGVERRVFKESGPSTSSWLLSGIVQLNYPHLAPSVALGGWGGVGLNQFCPMGLDQGALGFSFTTALESPCSLELRDRLSLSVSSVK